MQARAGARFGQADGGGEAEIIAHPIPRGYQATPLHGAGS